MTNIDISYITSFLDSLDVISRAKTLRMVRILSEFGHELHMPHSKSIGRGLYELRVRGNPQIRIFYAFSKSNIVLLHGFIKKSQKIPQKELQRAKKIMKIGL